MQEAWEESKRFIVVTVYLQRGIRAVKLALILDHGAESILRFQILFGSSSLLKDFKTYFSLFMGWEEERFHEVRKD